MLRLPHGGGTATLLRPDLHTAIDYRIPGVPAIGRTLAASLEDKTVYAVDTLGRLINLDLLRRTMLHPDLAGAWLYGRDQR